MTKAPKRQSLADILKFVPGRVPNPPDPPIWLSHILDSVTDPAQKKAITSGLVKMQLNNAQAQVEFLNHVQKTLEGK